MLITSRDTRRWVIPKGWPIAGLSPAQTAAREAFEEAGVAGQMSKKPIGQFPYDKRLDNGQVQKCMVTVFGLEAMIQHPAWPEQGQRDLKWFDAADAAKLVDEPDLAKIIRAMK